MNLEHSIDNIFGLEKPENYRCKIGSFVDTHTLMVVEFIRFIGEPERLTATFHYVLYFQGWVAWKNANFRLASNNDYLHFAHTLGWNAKRTDEQLLEGAKGVFLFTASANAGETQIHIIAHHAKIGDKTVPPDELWDD